MDNLTLSYAKRDQTAPTKFISLHNEVKDTLHNYDFIFTDGSVSEHNWWLFFDWMSSRWVYIFCRVAGSVSCSWTGGDGRWWWKEIHPLVLKVLERLPWLGHHGGWYFNNSCVFFPWCIWLRRSISLSGHLSFVCKKKKKWNIDIQFSIPCLIFFMNIFIYSPYILTSVTIDFRIRVDESQGTPCYSSSGSLLPLSFLPLAVYLFGGARIRELFLCCSQTGSSPLARILAW